MSNSIAMPRCRGSASCMPSGSTIVGSGRLRRFGGCAAFLPLPFLAPPAFSFGGGGASNFRQPVGCCSVPARGPASSSSTSSTSPSAGASSCAS